MFDPMVHMNIMPMVHMAVVMATMVRTRRMHTTKKYAARFWEPFSVWKVVSRCSTAKYCPMNLLHAAEAIHYCHMPRTRHLS